MSQLPIRIGRAWKLVGASLLAVALVLAPSSLASQDAAGGNGPSGAVVTFTLDFPHSTPEHYSITVTSSGHATFQCTGKIADDSEVQPYLAEFELSAVSRDRIFALAKEAKYFAGKIDSGNQKSAFTGSKVLSYRDGVRSNTAKYGYSSVAAVQALTALFQNIAGTQEYGRRLEYYHRYQKLALDEELKNMQTQARNNELSELQGIAPVLREILEDPSVINGVRARAKALIEMGDAGVSGR